MVNFTLIEVHLDDGNLQLGPSGVGYVPDEDAEFDEGEATEIEVDGDEESSGGRGLLSYLLVLAVLAGVAFAAKQFLGGGADEGFEELEELDDLADEA
ncbi:hypothetical protein ACFO0N_03870 [Halobium salinum]|uniref:Uncharacterized protein n=1 Tax=Halobium salinum TaxID=1364940 RepID=A0ABD5P8P4_9EURY|nr:hypothetical protein [Halobium salinum]